RLFINGSFYQLNSDFWIEIDGLIANQDMFILCKSNLVTLIEKWAAESCAKPAEKLEGLDGMPGGHALFKITNPSEGCDSIPALFMDKDISIELIGGLKAGYRTYADTLLPLVFVHSAGADSQVYLHYRDSDEPEVKLAR